VKVLVDSSIWIDHIHKPLSSLILLLDEERVLSHPMVIGEVAMGSIKDRNKVLRSLQKLPSAQLALDAEVLQLVDNRSLHGTGIGYIDAHLVASARLTFDALLWTRDTRLAKAAAAFNLAFKPVPQRAN
jgi:predicted nucleic acid-binding protein